MKNNIVITDSEQFEEVIRSLEASYNKIKEIFISESNNKEYINSTDIWTGTAQEAMYEKYNLLSNNFYPIENSLDIYIRFLKKTIEDYKRYESEISNNIDKLENEFNVNS